MVKSQERTKLSSPLFLFSCLFSLGVLGVLVVKNFVAERQERVKSETPALRGYSILQGLLLFALLLMAVPAQAHPLPLSYVDLRLNRDGLEVSVEVPAVDLAHDLPQLSVTMLLAPSALQAHQQEVVALLTSRLTLQASGKTLTPSVEGIAPILDQKDVKLRLRYAWQEPPANLHIECRLFPYDPSHQTYVDVYEEQALKREMIFDSQNWQQDYVQRQPPECRLGCPAVSDSGRVAYLHRHRITSCSLSACCCSAER